ncbi:8784_t:CDS:2 [Cetraspora pellucida]|uniref:8784_t:CDS:1 n=1 Tax=Cetraspora pellucida TaxID=1433469 RepID=A0A9N9DI28_9GLOM|nr:8784_t:CDS:2 [Cetraspora pellucida]
MAIRRPYFVKTSDIVTSKQEILDLQAFLLQFVDFNLSLFIGDREVEPVSYSSKDAKATIAFLCYSSGITGNQKGDEITHTNAVANMAQISSSYYLVLVISS